MKKIGAVLCLLAVLLCGCSQSNSQSSSTSELESLSSEPYYMEDIQCLYVNDVLLNLLDLEIIPVEDERNLEDVPVLLVSYMITNNTAGIIDAKSYQEQHLDVLYNYESEGKGFRPSNARIDPDAFFVNFDEIYDESIQPDSTGTYLSAFKVTDDLETVTLRFIADDAANPLGTETIPLSEISIYGSESTPDPTLEESSEDESVSEPAPSSKPESTNETEENSTSKPTSSSQTKATPKPTAKPTAKPTPKATPEDTTTAGEKNALRAAKNYLDFTAFSYSGLIKQLEYEGYSNDEAVYAADNCGANWNQQALKSAKNYLDYMPFSYSGLIKQLEYEGFTTKQATYGVDNCKADWNKQAVKAAKNYLDYMDFSRDGLIQQLEFDGFTHEQAVYGAEANGY